MQNKRRFMRISKLLLPSSFRILNTSDRINFSSSFQSLPRLSIPFFFLSKNLLPQNLVLPRHLVCHSFPRRFCFGHPSQYKSVQTITTSTSKLNWRATRPSFRKQNLSEPISKAQRSKHTVDKWPRQQSG